MFGYIFRTGTYYLVWKKFKKQIITLVISSILIMMILGIYNDLFTVLKIANKDNILGLMVLKYFLIAIILIYNYFSFKRLKVLDSYIIEEPKKEQTKQQQNIMTKAKLKTKTDVILQKYLDKR